VVTGIVRDCTWISGAMAGENNTGHPKSD